jgi:hypothetical protein
MASDLPASTIVDFIIGDLEATWTALAVDPRPGNRGNFLFALQAVVLLKLASRLCASDPTGIALSEFSAQLAAREPRYFTPLPSPCVTRWTEFTLPYSGPNPSCQLLPTLFDLIRNGQAHQYQQIRVRLNDGVDFQVSLTGAERGLLLNPAPSRNGHLEQMRDQKQDLWLKVRTDILFLDIRDSVRSAHLLGRGLSLTSLARPRAKGTYEFSGSQLQQALRAGGH